ncbi:hypothetical protein LWI29_012816 [Acer saccharum]|uniref:Uncharacterized protein n=1 Tax=Acer saccharum TaxID=4024 RepID=A0AA39S703_ACESA|nr:hypothetical protein LWI29_012816 [Acer saccharum]
MTRIAKQEVLPRVGMTWIGKQEVMARVGRTRIVMHGRLPRGKSALDRELANILVGLGVWLDIDSDRAGFDFLGLAYAPDLAKNGCLSFSSNLFKILTLYLHSSSLSPNPKLKTSTNPKATSKRPISLSTQDPRIPLNFVVISSDATNLCSLLLTDRKALDFNDFDCLLKGYKNKLNSNLVLEILMNYRQLGRMKTLEFFS